MPLHLSYCPGTLVLCTSRALHSPQCWVHSSASAKPRPGLPTPPTLFIWLIAAHPCRLVSGTPVAGSIPRAPFLQTSCHLPRSTYLHGPYLCLCHSSYLRLHYVLAQLSILAPLGIRWRQKSGPLSVIPTTSTSNN